MTQALSLRRLTELVQGTTTLSQGPIWLLGKWYGVKDLDCDTAKLDPEGHEAFLRDFRSRIWCTYRRDFTPIGTSGLTSDVGWGCTVRSSQMLLAEALMRHRVGRQWARGAATPPVLEAPVLDMLSWFQDVDSADHPLSIHGICAAGQGCGVVPGKWLGPWVLCKTLEALLAQPAAAALVGLRIHVVGDPGGGAPIVDGHRINALLQPPPPPEGDAAAWEVVGKAEAEEAAAVAAAAAAAAVAEEGDSAGATATAAADAGVAPPPAPAPEAVSNCSGGTPGGLLLLVPLTLGVDKVSPLYHPQLQAVLGLPQSVGIVGGRPGASLYFVGWQDGNLLYLDPHEGQPAPALPAAAGTFFCDLPRLMPLTSLDPSLAMGFYCASQADFADLCGRLSELAVAHRGAPLMTVATEQMRAAVYDYEDDDAEADAGGASSGGEEAALGEGEADGGGVASGASPGGGMSASPHVREGGHGRVSQQHEDWEMI